MNEVASQSEEKKSKTRVRILVGLMLLTIFGGTSIYLMGREKLGEFETHLTVHDPGGGNRVEISLGIEPDIHGTFELFNETKSKGMGGCSFKGSEDMLSKRSIIDILMLKPSFNFRTSCSYGIGPGTTAHTPLYELDKRHPLYDEGPHELLRYKDKNGDDILVRLILTKTNESSLH
ncbi:MAG: hypothetical protein KDA65_12290 [Planctomycetaceae bacterium]|nr:hypothetical protein [Planctomycetaceae bacterium]